MAGRGGLRVIGVRLGTDEDVPRALAVFAAAEAARRGSPVGDDEPALIATRINDGARWLLVAEEDGAVVGMAVAYDSRADEGAGDVIPGQCHLGMVFVLPHTWGRGVGAAVVDEVLAEARRRGYARIELWTHEDNERAKRLYTTRGFRRTGRTKDDDRGQRIGLWARSL